MTGRLDIDLVIAAALDQLSTTGPDRQRAHMRRLAVAMELQRPGTTDKARRLEHFAGIASIRASDDLILQ